ncbi:general stress protein [Micromonospora sp. NPDC050397]|uniref:general stress protein n=1 Tax=Micromonospora sp. NPDC050397 TaxID=3364279 RepID=UPI00384B27E7
MVTTPSTPGAGDLPPGPAGKPVPPAAGGAVPELAPPTVTVATYPDYAAAQRAVDYLSDSGFPVQHTAIVGTGLRLVENVIGRMTTGRAASAGAASGAWFGLFIGLLFGIFSSSSWFGVLIAAVVIGAVWGAIFGASAHAMTRGRRDFTSRSSLQAEQYAVAVDAEHAEEARQLVVRLNWRTSEGSAGQ